MKGSETEILQDLSWVERATPWPWWVWVLVAGALVILALAGAAYFWQRKQKRHGGAATPRIPAHVIALEALRKLEGRISEDKEMEFTIEVSRILRVYIQNQFELRAPHRSTEEFLWEASESSLLSFEQQGMVSDFLGLCDRVKFARRHVRLEKMKQLFAAAHKFVEETAEPKVAREAGHS